MLTNSEPSVRDRIMIAAIELADQQGTGRVTIPAVAACVGCRGRLCTAISPTCPDVSRILEAWVQQEVPRVAARRQVVLEPGAGSDPKHVLGGYIDLQLT